MALDSGDPAGKMDNAKKSVIHRLYRTLGPIAAGMVLDFLDLATVGPIGLYVGAVVGGIAGWWLAGLEGLGSTGRWVLAVLSAIYMSVPLTEPIPVATLLGAVARFLQPQDREG